MADPRVTSQDNTPARRFRKKPVVIEAVQLTWQTWSEVCEFVGKASFDAGFVGGVRIADGTLRFGENAEKHVSDETPIAARIPTLEGVMVADQGDWIIRGIQGEFYPCKPDIFEATYEAVPRDC